ncbi:MAG: glycoside hydrolase family 99-like domain-containing protein [Spirochaetes bacterium]|nr:glycoside hydrolase family 99-like domain-containing protein [Spirochaetota bacterium]
MKYLIIFAAVMLAGIMFCSGRIRKNSEKVRNPDLCIGAYYFDGWAGKNNLSGDPDQPWAENAPLHLTRRMLEEFPEREPVWGWRDDSLEIMEQQIDTAADNGLAFFSFCWFWHDNKSSINENAIRDDPKNTGLDLFLKSGNSKRMQFCLMIANHDWFEITGPENWEAAAQYLMPYLTHEQYLKINGKPLVIIFNGAGGDKAGFDRMQKAARDAGLPGLAIACNWYGTPEQGYQYRTHYMISYGYEDGAEKHSYAELITAAENEWRGSSEQPYIPVVTAGFDKRPWEGPNGLFNKREGWYYTGRTPALFRQFLEKAVSWIKTHPEQTPDEHVILICAWNEYGEGAWIAPTKGDRNGEYLKVIRSLAMADK